MGNYDFGYTVYHGSTVEWALETIQPGSTVLEFGPYNGNLTKHLKENHSCTIDIVELNEQAGRQAAAFARDAVFGAEEGNIEAYTWAERYAGRTYDYIVFLDVLEHLIDTDTVLESVRPFLKENGKILLSIPNIAYNGIILNLMQNQFRYTDLGLLDYTHMRFFSYHSLVALAERLHYCSGFQALQLPVADSELNIDYGCVPEQVANYLKQREYGNVYQYLVMLRPGDEASVQENRLKLDNVDNKALLCAYVKENGDAQFCEEKKVWTWVYPGNSISTTLTLTGFKEICQIRIDPLECPCLLRDIQVIAILTNGQTEMLEPCAMTGVPFVGGYLFGDNDPQILFDIAFEGIERIVFTAQLLLYHSEELTWLQHSYEQLVEQQNEQLMVQKMLEAERTAHGIAQDALEAERTAHKSTEDELEAERTAHGITQDALEAESAAHNITRNTLSAECVAHSTTKEHLARVQETNDALSMALEISAEDKATLLAIKEELEIKLFAIHNSRGWKMLSIFYNLKNWLFRRGS